MFISVADANDKIALLQAFILLKTNQGTDASHIVAAAFNQSSNDLSMKAADVSVINAVFNDDTDSITVYTEIDDKPVTVTISIHNRELYGEF
jgi:hypothetical protein